MRIPSDRRYRNPAILAAVMLLIATASAAAQEITLQQVHVVVLSKGPNWTDADTPEHDALQRRHAEYRLQLAADGVILAAGPIRSELLGPEHRGFSVYLDQSEEEITALNDADPKIAAGHLTYHVIAWYIPTSTYDDLLAVLVRKRQARAAGGN